MSQTLPDDLTFTLSGQCERSDCATAGHHTHLADGTVVTLTIHKSSSWLAANTDSSTAATFTLPGTEGFIGRVSVPLHCDTCACLR